MAIAGWKGSLVIIAAAWIVTSRADEYVDDVTEQDTSCMLQRASKNESHLTSWDKDFIKDGDGDAVVTTLPLTPDELLRLTSGCFIALVVLLLGVIACMITGQQEIAENKMAWFFLNHVIASLSALLLFRATKELLKQVLTLFAFEYALGVNFVLFFMIFLVVYVWLIKCESSDEDRNSSSMLIVGLVGMYAASFAATDTFSMLVQTSTYVKSNAAYTIATFCAVLGVVAFISVASTAKKVVTYEDQFAAVVVGYLACQAVETSIIRTQPVPTTRLDTDILFVVMCGFICLSLLVAALTKGEDGAEPGRLTLMFRNVCLMAAAWCVFDAVTWQMSGGYMGQVFGLAPETHTASFLAALVLTSVVLIAFVLVLLYALVWYGSPWDDFQTSSFLLIVGAMGFAIGTAWASYLIAFVVSLGPEFFVPQHIATAAGTAVTCFILTAVILSIWTCGILPNAQLPKLTTEGSA